MNVLNRKLTVLSQIGNYQDFKNFILENFKDKIST